jgi:RimJ/RimL family protein N-acetyltransferase
VEYIFESDRLRFRRMRESDLPFLMELDSDPAVMKYVDGRRPKSRDQIKATLARVLSRYEEWKDFGLWICELKSDGSVIGWFALKPLPGYSHIELGYRLLQKHWGHGYATEGGRRLLQYGFNVLKLNEIVAITDPQNQGSQKVLSKLGFLASGELNYRSPVEGKEEQVSFFRLSNKSCSP